jgi:hypothetical protein
MVDCSDGPVLRGSHWREAADFVAYTRLSQHLLHQREQVRSPVETAFPCTQCGETQRCGLQS